MVRLFLCLCLAGLTAAACTPKKVGDAAEGGGSGGDSPGTNGNTQPGSNLPGTNPSAGDLTGPTTRFIGRVAQQAQYGALMTWPGSGAQLSFTGSQISIGMTNSQPVMPNFVDVYIDNSLAQTIQVNDNQSNNLYPISVSGSGLHTITVIKRNEPLFGHILFQGFQTNGAINPNTLARPARLIEFIGDNVVAGYGAEGPVGNPASCPSPGGSVYPTDAKYNGANSAFPVLTAKALNADWSVIGYSARGVAYNLSGTSGSTLPTLWQLQNPLDIDTGTWGFQPAADVVVINAGTSDINYWFKNSGKPTIDKTGFTNTYAAWLGQIRQKYPNARIIATLGPMLSQYTCPQGAQAAGGNCTAADGTSVPSALALGRELVQAAIAKAADNRTTYLEFPANSTNVSCDYHPDKTGHANIAALLVPEIRKVTGWSN